MPYIQRLNNTRSLGTTDAQQLIIEFNALRTEIDDVRTKNAALLVDVADIRTKYAALVALLVAATALGAGYSTGTGLAAATVTALGARQFTAT